METIAGISASVSYRNNTAAGAYALVEFWEPPRREPPSPVGQVPRQGYVGVRFWRGALASADWA